MTTLGAPLGSPAFFTPSLFALQNTSNRLASSTARLASGNRIIKASDDVAGLSIATRLQSQLSNLKQANQNAAQGNSLLQVASGALTTIVDLLDSMNALATQANSSSLTTADRAFLQTEFEANLAEIDRIAGSTTFNNITLLDGSLSGQNKALTQTSAATKATGTITFSVNPSVGQTVVLNGVSLVADTDFAVGLTAAATATNLYNTLRTSTNTALSQVSYADSGGGVITITAKAGGEMGNQFIIDEDASTAAFAVGGAATVEADVYTLSGGEDDGLSINSVKAVGTIGDALVTTQAQTPASVTLTVTGTISNGELLRFDNGDGGLIAFTFASAASLDTDIQIGASTEETLQNAIETISQYSEDNDNDDNYGLRQLEFAINGNSLVITRRTVGNATDLNGANLDISETMTNASLSAATFSNGATTGVNTSGVTNGDFVGTIEGFAATYVSSDTIDVSLTVGSSTYSTRISDTTPAGDTTIRFSSTSGGYFDVQLDGGEGSTVSDQTTANIFASRLNSAFEGLTFYQERPITNFDATGDFLGASAKVQLDNFSDVRLNSISVTAPTSTDATIEIRINETTFRASTGIGGTLGAFEQLKFTSLDDANQHLILFNGSAEQDFSDTDAAALFETALREAFGLDEAGEGVDFQVGTDPTDVINVVVGNSQADQLFNGATPDISTQENAADAQTLIETALNTVQGFISSIGAVQSRLENAAAVIGTTIQGVEQARSIFADTDIAEEATTFAQETLKLNAAVAVIAQAQNLQSSLLNILQSGIGK